MSLGWEKNKDSDAGGGGDRGEKEGRVLNGHKILLFINIAIKEFLYGAVNSLRLFFFRYNIRIIFVPAPEPYLLVCWMGELFFTLPHK